MHNVIEVNNLISEQEQMILRDWIVTHQDTSIFYESEYRTERRRDTSAAIPDRFTYPQCAFDIRQRIVDNLKLEDPKLVPYPYGMVASYVNPGDVRSQYLDGTWHEDHTSYCCITSLSPAEGISHIVAGKEYALEARAGLFYTSSELAYSTTELIGTEPKMFWLFGFSVPNEQTEN